MLYEACRGVVLRVLKTPLEPPEPPAGSHASVQVFRASPRFLTYRMLGFWIAISVLWIAWWVLLIAAFAEREPAPLVIAVLGAPLLLAVQFVGYFATRIDYELRTYIVTDRSLRVREGAIVVKEMTVTHANVQNLHVVQGPLQRAFGISSLKVDTAGGGAGQKGQHETGHSIQMAGIENAHEVRDLVLGYLQRHGRTAGLGDPDDLEEGALASPGMLEAVRAIRDAARSLRAAAEARA